MRVVLALLVCAVLAAGQGLVSVSPSWEKAVQDASAQLVARESEVSRLHGQCQASRGVLLARRTAHEEAQQNVVGKKVIVTQSEAHHRGAVTTHATAKATLESFKAGPFATAHASWQAQLAQRADLESKQSKIAASRKDVAVDFPNEARANAQRDLDVAQLEVTRRVTAFNNAKVAYDAAVLTLNQHSANFKTAQTALDGRTTALAQARATLATSQHQRGSRLAERKSARAAYDSCVNQLTQAKQAKVAAVGGLRTALETLLQNMKAVHFNALQTEQTKQQTVESQRATVQKFGDRVKDLSKRIEELTRRHAETNQRLARAIADYTVAQTHYENSKQRRMRVKNRVEKAKARVDTFSALHPTVGTAPSAPATPPAGGPPAPAPKAPSQASPPATPGTPAKL